MSIPGADERWENWMQFVQVSELSRMYMKWRGNI